MTELTDTELESIENALECAIWRPVWRCHWSWDWEIEDFEPDEIHEWGDL